MQLKDLAVKALSEAERAMEEGNKEDAARLLRVLIFALEEMIVRIEST